MRISMLAPVALLVSALLLTSACWLSFGSTPVDSPSDDVRQAAPNPSAASISQGVARTVVAVRDDLLEIRTRGEAVSSNEFGEKMEWLSTQMHEVSAGSISSNLGTREARVVLQELAGQMGRLMQKLHEQASELSPDERKVAVNELASIADDLSGLVVWMQAPHDQVSSEEQAGALRQIRNMSRKVQDLEQRLLLAPAP